MDSTVLEWLLDSDPSIRWQVMRDLVGRTDRTVAAERSRVAREGWGARLLSLQADDGQWGGGAYGPKWTSTTYTLLLLRHLGLDPSGRRCRAAIAKVDQNVTMGRAEWPFFEYRGETCITGMCLTLSAYFQAPQNRSDQVVDWLLTEQLADGGWNCETVRGSVRSSFNTTISVLEGLLEYERARGESNGSIAAARRSGNQYLLERRLFRSLTTGEVINPRWRLFSFPPRWHYDVLRGLDYLRDAGEGPDERCEEAIALVERKRDNQNRWPLQNHHSGKEHFKLESRSGTPSRWNTLRALRVLRWYDPARGNDLIDS